MGLTPLEKFRWGGIPSAEGEEYFHTQGNFDFL